MTPSEYLRHASLGLDRHGFHPRQPLVVYGNISLQGVTKGVLSLPPARLVGGLSVKDSPALVSCHLDVEGPLEITGCHNLSSLRGSARFVSLDGTGLESIGADFECRGDMKVRASPLLTRLNCRVRMSLFLRGEIKVVTGPAFSCGVALVLDGGAAATDSAGKLHGGGLGSPPRLMQGSRFSRVSSKSDRSQPLP